MALAKSKMVPYASNTHAAGEDLPGLVLTMDAHRICQAAPHMVVTHAQRGARRPRKTSRRCRCYYPILGQHRRRGVPLCRPPHLLSVAGETRISLAACDTEIDPLTETAWRSGTGSN